MSNLVALENLNVQLIHSRGEAISLGDDLLVYLLNMAISHVRKKSNAICETKKKAPVSTKPSLRRSAQVYDLPDGPTEAILTKLFTALC
jgi:hypothetical protein